MELWLRQPPGILRIVIILKTLKSFVLTTFRKYSFYGTCRASVPLNYPRLLAGAAMERAHFFTKKGIHYGYLFVKTYTNNSIACTAS